MYLIVISFGTSNSQIVIKCTIIFTVLTTTKLSINSHLLKSMERMQISKVFFIIICGYILISNHPNVNNSKLNQNFD